MKIFQHAELSADPTNPMDATTKQYVDNKVAAGTSIVGGLFFTNIAPTGAGIVGSKAYVPNTSPANKVITDGTTDTPNVRVTIIAEGGSAFYSPTVTITAEPTVAGSPFTVPLTEDTYDHRYFSGFVDIPGVTVDTVLTATSSTGATATATVHAAPPGPALSLLTIGSLPGSQTEVKSGDVVPVSGKVQNTAVSVRVIAGGASSANANMATLGAADSGGVGYKSFSGFFTVGSGTGSQSVTANAANTLGTYGSNFVSSNQVTLNQTFPTIGTITVSYPATQSALKGSEAATVSSTITNADTVTYTSSAELSVTNPGAYGATKTVTRIGGTYTYNVTNYFISATKASNGATSSSNAKITVANAAPTAAITITGSPARLTSSAAGQSYIVNITANQLLNAAPTLVASIGTFQGSWTFSGGVYSRTLLITDANAKGAATFNTLSLAGLANVAGTTITSGANYSVGGFARRLITVPAFAQIVPIGTSVVTIAKTNAKYSGQTNNLTLQASTANVFQGYTITDAQGNYNATGSYMFITDSDFAGANTSGTLIVEIEEVA